MRRSLVLLLAAGALMAGCSGTKSGTATTASSSAPAESSGSSGSAPKVASPLNTASIESNACSALSAAKRSELGLGEGEQRTTSVGPGCSVFAADDRLNQIEISPVLANKNGLSDVYDTRANNEYFEPTEISGYPAVYAASLDARKSGKCGLFVGVTDRLAVNILVQYDNGPGASEPCPVAQKVGEAMIETLKEG
jgi:ABC-type Fe3+-hydroxamate transport system substrate-binding protein